MNKKNQERVQRIIIQLKAVLETDKELIEQEENSVEMALYHLGGLVDGIAYVTDAQLDDRITK